MASQCSCQLCGQQLRNAFFCRDCLQAFCSVKCYELHVRSHAVAPPRPAPSDPSA
jgi:hypothetical protein